MKRILFPVEDLNIPEKALEWTLELGKSFGAVVVLLHVQPYNEPLSYPYAHLHDPWDDLAFNQVSEQIIMNAVSKFAASGLKVRTHMISGNPATKILECAGKENCDMIIMSTHSMNSIKRFLLGSVTNKVVLHAKIPVLVVR